MIKYVLLLDIHISVARGCAFSFSQIFVIYNDLIAEPLIFASTTKGKLDMVLIFFQILVLQEYWDLIESRIPLEYHLSLC